MKKKTTKKHEHDFKAIVVVFTCKCGEQRMANVPDSVQNFLSIASSNTPED